MNSAARVPGALANAIADVIAIKMTRELAFAMSNSQEVPTNRWPASTHPWKA
jgi:hypothetical protein